MADILIRGMEMPTEQRIEVIIFKNGFVAHYDVYGRYLGQAKAIPLPGGHGRLGDLDALQEEFKKSHDGKRLMLIDTAPTIVPAEGDEADEKPV